MADGVLTRARPAALRETLQASLQTSLQTSLQASLHETWAQKGAFSDSYREARDRFRAAAELAGFELESERIEGRGPAGEDLTIDVAIRRAAGPARRAVVVSSGLHGVEGFFGSAVQLACLRDAVGEARAADVDLILIHALNPYGFAWVRRWNEDNVDLNRSFFPDGATRPDIPEIYRRLVGWLNPTRPPSRFDLSSIEAAALAARHGFAALKAALPIGQYEYPRGLFFGGHRRSATQSALERRLAGWLGPAPEVLHLDLHTGLGVRGGYKLLVEEAPEEGGGSRVGVATPAERAALRARFGAGVFEGWREPSAPEAPPTAYPARGLLADWAPGLTPEKSYAFITAEFGTYPEIKMLRALRSENQAHHWGRPEAEHAWTKTRLIDAFNPVDAVWRATVVRKGLGLIAAACADARGGVRTQHV